MPSSPLDVAEFDGVNVQESTLAKELAELNDRIDHGVSLSGHERNCAFLNVPGTDGSRRFVTASAAMGLDFDDDARSPALVDWDRDGDLDLWMTNRTAPMLRFVKNESPQTNRWIAIRLRGKTCNADAIGAYVEITLEDGRKISQTLKAGEGYLAQSSKWLHFGLGEAQQIKAMQVRWPDGKTELFVGSETNKRFHATQGEGRLREDKHLSVKLAKSAPLDSVKEESAVHELSLSRWPIPLLPYTSFDGQERAAGGNSEGFTLVNLWATWCRPCVAELNAFSKERNRISKAGLKVIALSVDNLAMGGQATSGGDPATFYKKLGIPFEAGLATETLVNQIENVYGMLYGPRWPLPVPTSVLLDQKGQLLAFYKGEVSPQRVLRDMEHAGLDDEAMHKVALPFAGRWFRRPEPLSPMTLPLSLMGLGQVEAAHELSIRAHDRLSQSEEYAKLRTWIGDVLMKQGRVTEALKSYTVAVEEDDNNVIVLNNLAWQLAAHPTVKVRDGKQAVRWAERAAELTKHQDPAVLDTLAAAYAQAGQFARAASVAKGALELATKARNAALVKALRRSLKRYQDKKSYPIE
ncbi:MAG: peroxiredoxin [Verrucomicrobiales bacterium]